MTQPMLQDTDYHLTAPTHHDHHDHDHIMMMMIIIIIIIIIIIAPQHGQKFYLCPCVTIHSQKQLTLAHVSQFTHSCQSPFATCHVSPFTTSMLVPTCRKNNLRLTMCHDSPLATSMVIADSPWPNTVHSCPCITIHLATGIQFGPISER